MSVLGIFAIATLMTGALILGVPMLAFAQNQDDDDCYYNQQQELVCPEEDENEQEEEQPPDEDDDESQQPPFDESDDTPSEGVSYEPLGPLPMDGPWLNPEITLPPRALCLEMVLCRIGLSIPLPGDITDPYLGCHLEPDGFAFEPPAAHCPGVYGVKDARRLHRRHSTERDTRPLAEVRQSLRDLGATISGACLSGMVLDMIGAEGMSGWTERGGVSSWTVEVYHVEVDEDGDGETDYVIRVTECVVEFEDGTSYESTIYEAGRDTDGDGALDCSTRPREGVYRHPSGDSGDLQEDVGADSATHQTEMVGDPLPRCSDDSARAPLGPVWAQAGDQTGDPESAQVITVDDDGSADFSSLATAVEQAQSSDVIEVAAGTYHEPVVVRTSDLSIVGAGADRTILESDRLPMVFEGVGRASLSGVTVRATGNDPHAAVLILSSSTVVSDSVVTGAGLAGVEIRGAGAQPLLRQSRIVNNRGSGVLIHEKGTAKLVGNEIRHNGADGQAGIEVNGPAAATLQRNLIEANGGSGVSAHGGAHVDLVSNLIMRNRFHGVSVVGRASAQSASHPPTRATVESNSLLFNGQFGVRVRGRMVDAGVVTNLSIGNSVGLLAEQATDVTYDRNLVTLNQFNYFGKGPSNNGRSLSQNLLLHPDYQRFSDAILLLVNEARGRNDVGPVAADADGDPCWTSRTISTACNKPTWLSAISIATRETP